MKKEMSLTDFEDVFGHIPTDDDLGKITQHFIKTYHTLGVDPMELVEGFGNDWLQVLLEYSERIEEYELCAIFRDLINEYKQK